MELPHIPDKEWESRFVAFFARFFEGISRSEFRDWEEEQISQARQTAIIEEFGTCDGILIIDEAGFLKSGNHSVGVQRQYSGSKTARSASSPRM